MREEVNEIVPGLRARSVETPDTILQLFCTVASFDPSHHVMSPGVVGVSVSPGLNLPVCDSLMLIRIGITLAESILEEM